MLNPEEIEITREMNKIGLDTFSFNLGFDNFQHAISDSIDLLEKQLDERVSNSQNLDNDEYILDIHFLSEQLLAISEMKIIYLYKSFEINLKRLIGSAYGINTKRLYKFENIKDFLNSKGINYSVLKGFHETNDVRKLNNFLKHSSRNINSEIANIEEFKSLSTLRHYELLQFYNRTKDYPLKFLTAISIEIYKDLYEFDEIRLDKIAELFAIRMDNETALKFIDILRKKY